LHSREITEKLANDLSYYDEDLFLASTEGVLILDARIISRNCASYWSCHLAIALFQIYDRKIDAEISNGFYAIKKLSSSRYYFLTQAPRKA